MVQAMPATLNVESTLTGLQTRIASVIPAPDALLSIAASSLVDAQVQVALLAHFLGVVLVLWALGLDRACTSVVLLGASVTTVIAFCESSLFAQASTNWPSLSASNLDGISGIAKYIGVTPDATFAVVVSLGIAPLGLAYVWIRRACKDRRIVRALSESVRVVTACVLVVMAHDKSVWSRPAYFVVLCTIALVPVVQSGMLFRTAVALVISWALCVHSQFGSVTAVTLEVSGLTRSAEAVAG
jgi:hypothetical protein